ncbi:MAG TPA: DNA methyltransferase [Longimicrobiales bacterium]
MPNPSVTESVEFRLAALAERWRGAKASERANFPVYIAELTAALGVDGPGPAGSGYQLEYPVHVVTPQGVETTHRIDLYKRGHFVLEGKDEEPERSTDLLLRKAFGQAVNYAIHLPEGPPPFLLVMDVGATLLVWQRRAGTYGGFNAAHRIPLRELADRPEDIALLRDIWLNPDARTSDAKAARVTREVAEKLARLAASLEKRGHDQEKVARFLIRCVFAMFAEDEGLLPGEPFTSILNDADGTDPAEVEGALGALWEAMDEGRYFGAKKLLRFNGHFFKDHGTLPLTRDDLAVLREAAQADWRAVEPTIFGTLLTRALDPEERHRLGAEYTPRAYVERLVRPTVEEPIRQRWTLVEAEVLQLKESGRPKDRKEALRRLEHFHQWLRSLRFLDPACGSGNFLYVTLATVKRIEAEVIRAMEALTGQHDLVAQEVGPWQFHGIEVKHWAREIAELTLWIGYHQFWREHHGGRTPPEPVLRDTGTLECRDAVLARDDVVEDPERARPDPTPRIPHPVTGKLVPDPDARLRYMEHVNPRPAEWPEAHFIIGNPPYLGKSLMRTEFGDGYVEALRTAYPTMPDGADYVMYWWHRAAQSVASGKTLRAGLITTNSIRQAINRRVIEEAEDQGVRLVWAIADHPWIDEAGAADVTVAMTVIQRDPVEAALVEVDRSGRITRASRVSKLNADLSAHADVAGTAKFPLRSNLGLAANGFLVYGRGFVLDADEAKRLINADPKHKEVIRPLRNGRDLNGRTRGMFVIDFGLRDEAEARRFPVLYDIVRARVKPYRDTVKDRARRVTWWQFGRTNENLRAALRDVPRFIATSYVSRHRIFTFLDTSIAAEDTVVCIASSDPFHLGVLSSGIHVAWALAAGGRLGVGNDPRYNKTKCFDAYPFPDPTPELRRQIADVAERLDRHRKDALARDERVTMTGMYNVVEKLRTGAALTPKEREVHEIAACGVLRDLHDELDRLVAAAYGWEWPLSTEEILARLVALHDERVAEERAGRVRWLRPDYQRPRFGGGVAAQGEADLAAAEPRARPGRAKKRAWPKTAVEQIAALLDVVAAGPVSVEEAASGFRGARRDLVERHLETLAIMGEVQKDGEGRFHAVGAANGPAA